MTEVKVEKIASAAEFIKRAVALRLKLARVGTKRAVDNDDVDLGDTDESRIRITKEILESEELNAIRNHDLETRAAIRVRALPSLLGAGWYLIPVAAVDPIDAFIRRRADEREALVEKLVEALPVLKEASKAALKHLWVEEQFPDASIIRDKCKVSFKYVTFDTPATLKGISSAILQREVQKAQAEASVARDAAVALLRAEMQKAVSALADAFVPGPSGRKPGLKPATLEKITSALNLFQARNIAQDERLSEFVEQAKGLIAGKTARDLKLDSKTEGSTVVADFQAIKASLAGLIEDGPSRTIDFEE
jgi:hypothetical protein